MSGIFDALPGIEAPVGAISSGLARMWAGTAEQGKPAPSGENAKAIQVNLVLHLGFRTGADDAVRQFETAVRFSRRYPSRVVVLCPLADDAGATEMKAKVYGECSVGKSKDDMRCCEFVMLSYPRAARIHLQNQVSICLSTDLPVYYWAHRFSDSAKLAEYTYLLTSSRRVLIDGATAPEGALRYPWPRPEVVRDLAFARLLPARQSIGQFLGRYEAAAIARGLRRVRLEHGAAVAAEARVLLGWVQERLGACGAAGFDAQAAPSGALPPQGFSLAFTYGDSRFFGWRAGVGGAPHASFDADFGTGRTSMPAAYSLLAPELALSEAMFF